MKKTLLFLPMLLILFLTACGGGPEFEDSVTVKNQNNEDVVIPGEKPTLLFFITTYT